MSEWKKVKLKDCCIKIGSGSTPKGGSTVYIDSGTSLIRSQNVYNLSFDYNGLTHITEDAAKKLKGVTILKNDILLNITGDSVARTCIVPDDVLPARVNQHVAIVRVDGKIISSNYLSYYLASPKMQAHMLSLAVGKGASRNAMTKQMIENFEVPCPPIEVQHRIATILSRYDSLIENYQKQIKLLEEAAQRLYKEWFVELRFPGYENTKMVDGLPEGWEKGVLEDIAFESGKKVDKRVRDNYKYYLPIDCLPKQSLTYLSPADISLAESSLVSFAKGDILFGAMRPYFHKVCFAQSSGLTRSTCFVLNAKDSDYQGFLLMLLFDEGTIKHATSISVGTTMPYTRWKEFKSMKILIPNKELAITFGDRIEIVKYRLMRLASQIRLLTEARDRLLPRLMGGEMEV